MFITLEEAKRYLRVDSSDEDDLILRLMETSDSLIKGVTRRTPAGLKRHEAVVRTAELYAIGILYLELIGNTMFQIIIQIIHQKILHGAKRKIF